MTYLIQLPLTFIYLTVLWVIVLVVYNLLFEAFDFGALWPFIGKSAILLGIISVISIIPYVHWFSLVAWWIGLMAIFKKDFWECRILVMLIWGLSFIVGLFVEGWLASRPRTDLDF